MLVTIRITPIEHWNNIDFPQLVNVDCLSLAGVLGEGVANSISTSWQSSSDNNLAIECLPAMIKDQPQLTV